MEQAVLTAIEEAAAAKGAEIDTATDDHVCVVQHVVPGYPSYSDFWKTGRGWIHAGRGRDGSYTATCEPSFARRTGYRQAQASSPESLSGMGVDLYPTAAKAILSISGIYRGDEDEAA
ncbi:MAG: hypothetical protein J0H34_23795 [Rhizobiales bacterium]|nr:hypothetical protein [Hyphomicrobiales bacterium]